MTANTWPNLSIPLGNGLNHATCMRQLQTLMSQSDFWVCLANPVITRGVTTLQHEKFSHGSHNHTEKLRQLPVSAGVVSGLWYISATGIMKLPVAMQTSRVCMFGMTRLRPSRSSHLSATRLSVLLPIRQSPMSVSKKEHPRAIN